MNDTDTIAAVATAPGRGGIGIVRLSGRQSLAIAEALSGRTPEPRLATLAAFKDASGNTIDSGLLLYFPGPHSFTGEDVVELQGHGGPVVMDMLLAACCALGARPAAPGEFSQRAFLNDKLDLAQAEAIADLIDSNTQQAVRNANRSLQGAFSEAVTALVEQVTNLRVYVEAAIDFPEEEIDFIDEGDVRGKLDAITNQLQQVYRSARQGALAREGMKLVIAGKPNAGKSSLLNALSGQDSAIVTAIEGTTRDVLKELIDIDGMPLHIVDTAGLRDSDDPVEQEGIRRAWREIETADHILLLVDASNSEAPLEIPAQLRDSGVDLSVVYNKCDLAPAPVTQTNEHPALDISAKTGSGIDALREHLKNVMGYGESQESSFSARRRHLTSLKTAEQYLQAGLDQLASAAYGELLAEDLRAAQQALGEITGAVSSDELLGKIFSSFCIGK